MLFPLIPLYIPLRSDETAGRAGTDADLVNFISHYVQMKLEAIRERLGSFLPLYPTTFR